MPNPINETLKHALNLSLSFQQPIITIPYFCHAFHYVRWLFCSFIQISKVQKKKKKEEFFQGTLIVFSDKWANSPIIQLNVTNQSYLQKIMNQLLNFLNFNLLLYIFSKKIPNITKVPILNKKSSTIQTIHSTKYTNRIKLKHLCTNSLRLRYGITKSNANHVKKEKKKMRIGLRKFMAKRLRNWRMKAIGIEPERLWCQKISNFWWRIREEESTVYVLLSPSIFFDFERFGSADSRGRRGVEDRRIFVAPLKARGI